MIDSVIDSSSPRAKLIEALTATVHSATAAGDLLTARVAREALAQLLAAPPRELDGRDGGPA